MATSISVPDAVTYCSGLSIYLYGISEGSLADELVSHEVSASDNEYMPSWNLMDKN